MREGGGSGGVCGGGGILGGGGALGGSGILSFNSNEGDLLSKNKLVDDQQTFLKTALYRSSSNMYVTTNSSGMQSIIIPVTSQSIISAQQTVGSSHQAYNKDSSHPSAQTKPSSSEETAF